MNLYVRSHGGASLVKT